MEKMWRLNRPLRRNRSLEHHQRCLNLVSTNTRGLEISTTSHSQNSVKCCVCSGVIRCRCGCLPHRYNIRGEIPLRRDLVNDEIWAMAEVSVTIVVACCPLLRPLLEKLIPKRLAQWAYSHGNNSTIVTIRPARLEIPEIFLP